MTFRPAPLASIRKILASDWHANRDASRNHAAHAIPRAHARRADAASDQRTAQPNRESRCSGERTGTRRAARDLIRLLGTHLRRRRPRRREPPRDRYHLAASLWRVVAPWEDSGRGFAMMPETSLETLVEAQFPGRRNWRLKQARQHERRGSQRSRSESGSGPLG